ncbi:MAG: type II toxin-antitoxin system RelE/ParE family toxin, partial [Wenzhouxiangella sp.]
MTRVFKTRTFARSTKKAGLTDATLWAAVEEMSRGLVDADLGGGVLKKRVALPGQGKRGG